MKKPALDEGGFQDYINTTGNEAACDADQNFSEPLM